MALPATEQGFLQKQINGHRKPKVSLSTAGTVEATNYSEVI